MCITNYVFSHMAKVFTNNHHPALNSLETEILRTQANSVAWLKILRTAENCRSKA